MFGDKLYLNSICSRLFISISIVMLPIYFFGVLIYSWGLSSIKDEIRNSSQARISYIKENIENEIYRINQLQLDYINDKGINNFINYYDYLPVYEMYSMVNSIQERLKITKNSSNYIENVIIHIPSMERTISSNSGFDRFEKDIYHTIKEHFTTSNLPLIIKRDPPFPQYYNLYSVPKNEKSIILGLVYPFPNSVNGTEPLFMTEVQLSNSYITSFFDMINNSNQSTILIASNGENIISSSKAAKNLDGVNLVDELGIELGQSGNKIVNLKSGSYLSVYSFSKHLNMTIFDLIPVEEAFRIPQRYIFIFWCFSIISLIVLILYSLSVYRFIHKPITTIVGAFNALKNGNFNIRIKNKSNNEFGYLFDGFNNMAEKLNELINRVYKQELYAKGAELKQLQSQINPHFLYNSFFILHRTIKSKEFDEALQLSGYLGGYFQYITRSTSQDEVKLSQEIEHMRNYAVIQSFRFHGRLSVKIDELDEKYKDILVPRLILQPLIENAIEHGMKEIIEGGIVHVYFQEETYNLLSIFVQDNGRSMQDDEIVQLRNKLQFKDETICTGIINVHRRLQLRFGDECGVFVERSDLGGLKVKISIKLSEVESHVQNFSSR